MNIEILPYTENFKDEMWSMLREYLTAVHVALRAEPWGLRTTPEEIEGIVGSTIDNLEEFTPPHGIIFMAMVDNEIAATASVHMIRSNAAEIKRMYVKPKYRGQRIGQTLLETVFEKAKAFGASKVLLDSPPPPEYIPARKLYEKFGFEFCDIYPECDVPDNIKRQWFYMSKSLVQEASPMTI